jgi:transcriptional regulator with XRE-family HTH domain
MPHLSIAQKVYTKNASQQLKNFRNKHQYTQIQASGELGYSLRTWQEYEQGRTTVPRSLLVHIAHYSLAKKLLKEGVSA